MKKKCIILVTSITLYKKIGIGKATAVTNKHGLKRPKYPSNNTLLFLLPI